MSKFKLLIIWNWIINVMTWIEQNLELLMKLLITISLLSILLGTVFLSLEIALGGVFIGLGMLCIILFTIIAIWTV